VVRDGHGIDAEDGNAYGATLERNAVDVGGVVVVDVRRHLVEIGRDSFALQLTHQDL
jgi:hypothetical protein